MPDSELANPPSSLAPEASEITAIRQQLANIVLENATAILNGAIEKAKQGHYSVTKLLFALAGIYPAPQPADNGSDHSLADLLCKELGLPSSNEEASQEIKPAEE